jgi:hypothetical protein
MTVRTSAGAPPADASLPGLVRPSIRPAIGRAARGAGRILRLAGATVVSALDGLLVGLVLAYPIATFISGPTKFLGLAWPLEALIAGGGAAVAGLLGAGLGALGRWLVVGLGHGVDRLLASVAGGRRWTAGARRLVALPIGFVRGFPAPWLGALAGILLLANVGVTIGPLPMFIPAGALGPYVVLTGIVTALAFAARRMLSGGRETGGATAARAGSATWRRACAALLVGTALVVGGGGRLSS